MIKMGAVHLAEPAAAQAVAAASLPTPEAESTGLAQKRVGPALRLESGISVKPLGQHVNILT
jgi:hypothetical protein